MIIVLAAVGLTLLAIAISVLASTSTWAENKAYFTNPRSYIPNFGTLLVLLMLLLWGRKGRGDN